MTNLTGYNFFDASKPNEVKHRNLTIMEVATTPNSENQYLRVGHSKQWFESSPYQIADHTTRSYKDCFEWSHITIQEVPANVKAILFFNFIRSVCHH